MMTNNKSTVEQIYRRLENKYASYYLINGAPQSGKSTFLSILASTAFRTLPVACQIFGPVSLNLQNRVNLASLVMQSCIDAAYIDELDGAIAEQGLVSVCKYLSSKLNSKRQFVVLLDIVSCNDEDASTLASLFSDIRFLEGDWKDPNFRIIFIVGGHWNESSLRAYYASVNVSFPYVSGHNYTDWLGIPVDDISNLANKCSQANLSVLQCRVLEEIGGGHPGVIQEILQKHGDRPIKLASLLRATSETASKSEIANMFVNDIQRLPEQSLDIIKRLLNNRLIASDVLEEHLNPLRTLGIVSRERTISGYFLRFRYWFAELLCRHHAESLGISTVNIEQLRMSELVPEISCINAEAYPLIHEVENLVRSFLVMELSKLQLSPLLQGLGQPDENNRTICDSAERWQRSSKLTLARQNPLIAFCSTRDLANLVEEVGYRIQVSAWHNVADSLRKLAYIRDAVMHNQLIDFEELAQLHTLRTDIMKAISQSSG